MSVKIHRCRLANHNAHFYILCPLCACQYCDRYWQKCPRTSWHPNHATSDAERGRRQRELNDGQRRSQEHRS